MTPDFQRFGDATAAEILRQAEAHLAAQLTVAVAADQRAVTLSGALATIAVAILGAGLAVITTEHPNYALVSASFSAGVVLLVGLAYAIHAARPVSFCFVGSHPRNWHSEADLYGPINVALWEIAQYYQEHIDDNSATLAANARYLRRALVFTFASPLVSFFIGLSVWWGVAVEEVAAGAAAAAVGVAVVMTAVDRL